MFPPVAQCEMRDSPEFLLIRVRGKHILAEGIFAAVSLAVVTGLMGVRYLHTLSLVGIALLAATLGFLGTLRHRDVCLKVTDSGFSIRGTLRWDFFSRRRFSIENVRWLEFREASGAGDSPKNPRGLYAVLRFGNARLLPYLDEKQVEQVIDAIENRFPEMAKLWHSQSPFGEHFNTLGLNRPN